MVEYEIPDDVQQLLDDGVETHEQLEILLLLDAQNQRGMTGEVLTARLGVDAATIHDALAGLERAGLVRAIGAGSEAVFRMAPATPALAVTVDRLCRAYSEHRIAVMNRITANALRRLRTSAMRAFARSFVLRRKDDIDG